MKRTLARVAFWALGGLTLVAVVTGGAVAIQRIQWEQRYRQVSLAVTAETALRLGEAGLPGEPLSLFRSVVLDAAALEAFAPLQLRPLSGFAPLDAPLSTAQVRAWRARGLAPVLVLSPLLTLDPPRLEALKAALAELAPQGVIVVDALAAWPPEALATLTEALEAQGAWLGTLEFSEPQGLLALYRGGWRRWVRAHWIPWRERLALSEAQAFDRYERAVRERSIRLLVLSAKGELRPFLAQAQALAQRLTRRGFVLGEVPELPPWSALPGSAWLLSLALWSVTLWLFQRIRSHPPWRLAALGGLTAGLLLWGLTRGDAGAQFLALWAAILWPMALYALVNALPERRGLGGALALTAGGAAFSLIGGVIEAGFLSDPAFFLRLAEFRGVKLALIEPILVIAWWELRRQGPGVWPRLWRRPLTWGEALLGAGALAGLVLLLARSGNGALFPPLPLEREVRDALENWLYARPRFKEFLVGYPLWVLWLARGRGRWGEAGVAVVALAFLSQTTLLNSFAHLHTPLTFTLLRALNGLLLGLLVGAAAWLALRWGGRRWSLGG